MGRAAEYWEEPEERPVVDMGPVQTIFVNGVASVDLIGVEQKTIRITLYADGKTRLDGKTEKIPQIEIIWPIADYAIARAEVSQRLKAFGIKWTGDEIGKG